MYNYQTYSLIFYMLTAISYVVISKSLTTVKMAVGLEEYFEKETHTIDSTSCCGLPATENAPRDTVPIVCWIVIRRFNFSYCFWFTVISP